MKFNGFMGGCGGKILTVIFSILLGVVLTLGGIAGGGYMLLTKKGMLLKAEELANSKGIKVDFDDTVAQGTLLEWGKELSAILKDTSNSTIGNIEKMIGISVISNTMNQMLGIDQEILKEATISNVGSTISSNLTMSIAKEKFNITFPDMPLFQDEEFLAKPIGQAFGELDTYQISKIITINETSHAALRALKDIAVKDLGGSEAVDAINRLCLYELMEINESSSQTLKALKYCTVNSFYIVDEENQKVVDEHGRYLYQKKIITIKNPDETETELEIEMQGIGDKIKELKIAEVIEINEGSHAALRKMRKATQEEIDLGNGDLFGSEDLLVDELGGSKFSNLVNNLPIGDLITVNEGSEPILIALKDTKISELNTKIQVLQLRDIFKSSDLESGALSLIDQYTTISGIPSAMTQAINNSTLITLKNKGLVPPEKFGNITGMPLSQQEFLLNSTLGDLVQGIINFIVAVKTNPLAPGVFDNIQHDSYDLSIATYSNLTEFTALYTQFGRINDDVGTIIITVGGEGTDDYTNFFNAEEGYYYIPIFNIETETVYNFKYEGGASAPVKVAVFDTVTGKMADDRYQYAFYYAYMASKIEARQVGLDAIEFCPKD